VYSQGKEIVPIRGHPSFLNGTDQRATENLTNWQQFIDWVYQPPHTYININHTEAIQYNIDRYNFTVEKNSPQNFTINLTRCMFNHNVLFTNPDGTSQRNWTLYDQTGKYIGVVRNEVFLRLENGIKYFLTTESEPNTPPNMPSSPSPTNGSIGNLLSLSWSISINEPEGNLFSWTIQCSNGQTNSSTGASDGTKSLSLSNLTFSKTYKVWVNATDPAPAGSGLYTRKWYTFKTKTAGGDGGGISPSSPENIKPVANASAGEPYHGLVNSEISFDGSKSYDPDGNITKWFWVFGDSTNGTGKTVTHAFSKVGTYTVTLTVTDNDNATNNDTTTCMISQINNKPPTTPIITGPIDGTKNTKYNYTALSTDMDNDTIQYIFDWGDSLSLFQSSGFLPNGTSFIVNHSWMTAGRYVVTVTVTDNQTVNSSKITVYIDAVQTGDIGYLVDNNGDGIYDAFYSDVSKQITMVQKKDGNYNIDVDGNGAWDYTFDATNNRLMSYQPPKTPGFELIIVVGAIALVLIWNRKRIVHN
jgi:PKD repeat protein